MRAISRRGLAAGIPLVSLLIAAFGAAPRLTHAANEFPSQSGSKGSANSVLSPSPSVRMRAPEALTAPDLVGQPLSAARARLESSGLRAGREVSKPTTARRPGTVIAQDPKAGTPIKPGEPINLWIAAAPPRDTGTTPGDRGRPSDDVGRAGDPPRHSDRTVHPVVSPPLDWSPPPVVPPRSPRFVLVPDLIGRDADQVPALLKDARLSLGERKREESEARTGTVTAQAPSAGTRVRPGTAVDVAVAVPLLVSVPDVTRHSMDQARELLAHERLALGARRTQPSEAPADTVLAQSPSAGTRVTLRTRVDVTVAVPILVLVPDVTGESPAKAREILEALKLELGERQRRASQARTGTVISQSPVVGTAVRRGTAVNVVLAAAIPAPPPIAVTPPAPPSVTVMPPAPPPTVVPPAPPTPAPPPAVAKPPAPPAPAAPSVPTTPAAPPTTPPASGGTPGPVTIAPPPEAGKASWPRQVTWSIGSALLLATASTIYYRVRTTAGTQPPPATPTLEFTPHWDPGSQQIGPAGPLCGGSGLRLVSGLETGTPTTLHDEHLVGSAHDEGGLRR